MGDAGRRAARRQRKRRSAIVLVLVGAAALLPPLPPGWTEHTSKRTQQLYWRHVDGTSTYTRPSEGSVVVVIGGGGPSSSSSSSSSSRRLGLTQSTQNYAATRKSYRKLSEGGAAASTRFRL